MGNEIDFKKAFDVFAYWINKDKALYYAYQSNIAMAFYDAVKKEGIDFPQLHDISNKAAKNFLDMLIEKGEKSNGK